MRKTLIFLLAALMALPLPAQSRYSVYKTKGTVRVCPKSESAWTAAERNRELQLGDRLQLEAGASVTIFDSSNSLLYPYETPGECTVMEAVRSVRDKAGSRTGAVNAEMKRSIEGHGAAAASYAVLGASFRAQGGAAFTDSLAVSLQGLAGAGAKDPKLALTIVPDGDAAVFKLRNGADIPLYVNILRISNGDPTVCLEFDGKEGSEGILLDAGAELVLDQYPFVVLDGARYLPFGTVRCYDTRSLQRALRRSDKEGALTAGFVY